MTWSDAKADAALRADWILSRLAETKAMGGEISNVVPLSDYATAADFEKILAGDPANWSFTYWRMVNRAVVRILKRRGVSSKLVKLHADELFMWLLKHGLPNTAENRAQFVSWKAAQPFFDPKPIPHAPKK